MTAEIALVFGILGSTIILFALDKFRLDLIALGALLSLVLTGLLTPTEALAGFADPVVIMIAGLFIVGGAIFESGIADAAGRLLSKAAGVNPNHLLLLIMLTTATLSAFLSSTGTVAVMLPVVISLTRRAGLSPSKFLIPLAFSSLLGGMLTLIGTPPNLVVSEQLQSNGLESFHFFAFTPVGLVMLLVGIIFMMTLGRRLLPERAPAKAASANGQSDEELLAAYGVAGHLWRLRVLDSSEVVGKTLAELCLRSRYDVDVLSIETPSARVAHARRAEPDSLVRAGDVLLVKGKRQAVERFAAKQDLYLLADTPQLPATLQLTEVILPPRSALLGKNLKEARVRERYGAVVLAHKRAGVTLQDHPSLRQLNAGDTLLMAGGTKAIKHLKTLTRDFIMISEPGGLSDKSLSSRAPYVLGILVIMLLLMTFGIVANVTAVLLAAVAMIVIGALSMDNAYQSINPESVVLIAAVLPLATALEKTGALELIVGGLLGGLGSSRPIVVLLLLFLITSLLSQVISNTATTVLLAPVAFELAVSLGLSPYPLLMTVAVAASTAFMTPVASPVNALVMTQGQYRFGDFLKVGAVMQVLVLVATLLVVPVLFPF